MSKVFVADKETQDKIKADTAQILNVLTAPERPKRYGYRKKKGEPGPSARIELLYDAVGMAPAYMDYDRGVFCYGDWGDVWFVRDNYACMLKSDGTEDYRLDPNDYDYKENGGGASEISNIEYDGNGMSAIPLVWVKRWEDAGWEYFVACQQQYDETYTADAHKKADGTIGKVAYHALFKGSKDSEGKLRSIAGQKPESNTTAEEEREAAKKNGDNWEIRPWSLHDLIANLLTLMSKTTNSQEAYGQGHSDGLGKSADDLLECGTLKDKGQFYGYSDADKAVKVFHIENFWGDRWDRLVGLVLDNGTYKAKMTPEGDGYNLTGEGYDDTGITITAASGQYQKNTTQTKWGCLPIPPYTGSDATYETVGFWATITDVRVAVVGGSCSSDSVSRGGARCLTVYDLASRASWSYGASLSSEGPSLEGGLGDLSPNELPQEKEGQPEAASPATARTEEKTEIAAQAAKK